MKNSREYAKKFQFLIERLRSEYDIPTPLKLPPIEQLISGFLMWECNSHRADTAYHKLIDSAVDFNDLRVFLPDEMNMIIGDRYPLGAERCERLKLVLNGIYQSEQDVNFDAVISRGLREVRTYLNTLIGMVPYVSAQVVLLSLNGSAMPVDEQLRLRLVEEGVIDTSEKLIGVQAWIERQVKSSEMQSVHLLLQGWVEESPPDRRSGKGTRNGSAQSASRRQTAETSGKKK